MTEKSYNNLKRGDIVQKIGYSNYYIVHGLFDEQFIDTQDISEIGHKTELGYVHDNLDYKYCKVVKNELVINAIKTAIKYYAKNKTSDVYSFIDGYIQGAKREQKENIEFL